jgi:hypothetical protein
MIKLDCVNERVYAADRKEFYFRVSKQIGHILDQISALADFRCVDAREQVVEQVANRLDYD